MVDSSQLLGYVAFAVLFVLVPIVVTRRPVVHLLRDQVLPPMASWATSRAQQEEPEAEELLVARTESRAARMRADAERLRHLVATDDAMSATRQIANRMAYEQLLADLAREPAGVQDWRDHDADATAVAQVSSVDGRRGPVVETLDVRWRP